jgi:hypothetical protein
MFWLALWIIVVLAICYAVRSCDDRPHVKFDEGTPFKELREPVCTKEYLASKEAYADFDYSQDGPTHVEWPNGYNKDRKLVENLENFYESHT